MNDIKQYSEEIHKPARKNFTRRKVYVFEINEIWCADLLDMSNISKYNDGYKFILNIMDIYSRYVWAFPIKNKSSNNIINCFKELKQLPKNLWVDEGKEFYNKEFLKFCKTNNINMYHTYSGVKSSFVERFNRTFREIFNKYSTEYGTNTYLDVLQDFIQGYNNNMHSSIKETPYNVYYNGKTPYSKYHSDYDAKPKFKVGDYVRISRVKKMFEKGTTYRWTKEIFKITHVDESDYPIMYKLSDLLDEEIKGKFYEQELLKTDLKDFALIEKIIRKEKNGNKYKYLVKWEGYDNKFNSYVDEKDIKELMIDKNLIHKK